MQLWEVGAGVDIIVCTINSVRKLYRLYTCRAMQLSAVLKLATAVKRLRFIECYLQCTCVRLFSGSS